MIEEHELRKFRWSLGLRGLAAVLFGFLAVVWPGITLMVLLVLFGAYALVDGISLLVGSLSSPKTLRDRWLVPMVGIFSILVGVLTFARPGMTAIVLLLLIGARAIFTGIVEIVAAIGFWRTVRGEWLLALGGILSVLFGVLVFAYPLTGALAVVWLIATYAIVYGLTQVAFAGYGRLGTRPIDHGITHPPVPV